MTEQTATPRTELATGDIVTIPSGKYPTDEWRIVDTLGDCLQIQRLYPRQGIANQIETHLPVRRVN